MRRRAGDRGSVSVELAVLMPAFVVLIGLAVVVGRQAVAQSALELAAHDAARAASLSRTAQVAEQRARSAAQETLARQGLDCVRLSFVVDMDEFAVPVGQPASVTVGLSCEVSFADVAMPGVPRSRTLTASFVSPLDRYRSREAG
jgi:Flp pilus assembly protein TadG